MVLAALTRTAAVSARATLGLLLGLMLGPPAVRGDDTRAGALRVADFSLPLGSDWRAESIRAETVYSRVTLAEGDSVLKATARDSASSIGRKLDVDPGEYPVLRWRWKVEKLPRGGNEYSRDGDDAAARILLIFKQGFWPWSVRLLCYLWGNTLPVGEGIDNPFSSRAKMIAVQSGPERAGEWRTEARDYVRDFERLFGEKPKQLRGIAILTDADNTGSESIAYYDFIELARAR